MNLGDIWKKIISWWELWTQAMAWLPQVISILVITLVLDFVYKFFSGRLQKKLGQDKHIYGNALVYAIQKPIRFFIWLFALFFSLEIIANSTLTVQPLCPFINPLRRITIIMLLTWAVIRFLNRCEFNLTHPPANRKAVNKTTALAVGRLVRILVVFIGILLVLGTAGINLTGLLAFGSAGTIVAGIAAKDLLANFFGGFMVFFDRPFAVGDWIKSPDKSIEGIVEHIGWRITRIRTFEKRPLYVPNAIFLNMCIENPSRMSNRRISETIGLRYSDVTKLPVILKEIEEMLQQHPDIDHNQNRFISFNKFGASSLDCLLQCFTKETKRVPFLKIQQKILFSIGDIVKKHGAEIAFPTTVVHLEK